MPPSTRLEVMHTLISSSEEQEESIKGKISEEEKTSPSLNKEGVVKLLPSLFAKNKKKKKNVTVGDVWAGALSC